MILLFLFPEMKQPFFSSRFSPDLSPRHVAGGVNSGTEGVFVQWLFREYRRLSLGMGGGSFSTGNAARMASLIWASHMEQAMPETLTVVWIIFGRLFRESFMHRFSERLCNIDFFHRCASRLKLLFIPAVAVWAAGGESVLPHKVGHAAGFAHGVVQTAQRGSEVI